MSQLPRVVSLLPSATEALCAIGGERLLVGRSHECDYPVSVTGLPVLTGQRTRTIDPAEIDREVSASLASGESLYTLDAERLAALKPDVILTQDLCGVCSIDLAAVRRVAAALPHKPQVVSLDPHTLDGVLDDLLTIGRAAGLARGASDAVVRLRARVYAAEEFVNAYADGPVVGFLEWTDPIYCAGHWTVQIIERAGGRHPLNPTTPHKDAGAAEGMQRSQRSAGKSVRVPEEAFAAIRPELIVIAPCGMSLDAARVCARSLAAKAWWRDLPAVRSGRVAIVDGSQMFNRPGPRLVDAFEWMVGWLNDRPELMPANFPWGQLRSEC